MDKLWELLHAVLHRAVLAVGVLPALLTLAAGGGLLALSTGEPVWALLSVFGALGSAEVFDRQRKADCVELRQKAPAKSLLMEIQDAHPDWHIKVLKEFEHGGLLFRVAGFDELEIPLSVTAPLCPRCGADLTERIEVGFPGRVRIEHRCACGFAQRSPYPLDELQAEAKAMGGCPR